MSTLIMEFIFGLIVVLILLLVFYVARQRSEGFEVNLSRGGGVSQRVTGARIDNPIDEINYGPDMLGMIIKLPDTMNTITNEEYNKVIRHVYNVLEPKIQRRVEDIQLSTQDLFTIRSYMPFSSFHNNILFYPTQVKTFGELKQRIPGYYDLFKRYAKITTHDEIRPSLAVFMKNQFTKALLTKRFPISIKARATTRMVELIA